MSPDYQTTERDKAIEDFKQRITVYETQYETIDERLDKHLSFIKIYNQGEKYLVNRIQGHVHSRAVYFLMNIHVLPRTIYLTRPGETDRNVAGKIGGGGDLTENGQRYLLALSSFMENQPTENLRVWTSLSSHTVQTAAAISDAIPREHWKALNELDAGYIAENMTYEEMRKQFPEEFTKRTTDKYRYRYPAGESYSDVVARLEPVIMELERQENVLVVCDQAVSRCLLAYFMDIESDDLPYLNIPLHTVIKLTPIAYGCRIENIPLGPDAVDTYVPRPGAVQQLSSLERTMRRRQASECTEPACCGSMRHRHQHQHLLNPAQQPQSQAVLS
jgi:6-phosphofructo-2-kinase/fructose-2,6-biphosphatase 1